MTYIHSGRDFSVFSLAGEDFALNFNAERSKLIMANVSASKVGMLDIPTSNATINGTAGDDVLTGTADADTINGLGGNDTIEGGAGVDALDGGAGNDILRDSAGSGSLNGGAGDDLIEIVRPVDFNNLDPENMTIIGGTGNDTVILDTGRFGNIIANLGNGDDLFQINNTQGAVFSVRTGTGRDTIILGETLASNFGFLTGTATRVIKDFTPGTVGDTIDFTDYLGPALENWDGASNPFSSGHMRLIQSGADTLLQIDQNGSAPIFNFNTLFTLENTTVASFTAENFAGYSHTGSPPVNLTIGGTTGDDTLTGGVGNDEISGGVGNDTLTGSNGNDRLIGGGGQDTLFGGNGADRLFGGSGNDFLVGGRGDDTLFGNDGNDSLFGFIGDDVLDGGSGDDELLDFGSGSDILSGGAGNDTITVRHLNQSVVENLTINGGIGNDVVSYENRGNGTATINLGDGNDSLTLFSAQDGSTVTLGAGNDTVRLESIITGFVGNAQQPFSRIAITDFQTGDSGDVLNFVEALSQYNNGSWDGVANPFATGHASLVQFGNSVILSFDFDGAGGGSGNGFELEIVQFQNTTIANFTAHNLAGVPTDGSAIVGQTINGTPGDDNLTGGLAGDTINGLAGDDTIDGSNGDDTIHGNDGNDTITGGRGADNVFGDAGDDVITDIEQSTFHSGDRIVGGTGNDIIRLEQLNAQANRFDRIFAGTGDDIVTYAGGANGNVLNSYIDLGSGNDVLNFGAYDGNTPTLLLGTGMDAIIFKADFAISNSAGTQNGILIRINDFETGDSGDRIDFQAIADNRFSNFANGDNPFAGGWYARLEQIGNDTHLQLDGSGSETNFNSFVIFKNTNVGDFTDFNLGYDLDAPQPPGITVNGTASGDFIQGTRSDDILNGFGGDDDIRGSDDEDQIDGGSGNDSLYGDGGDDNIIGGTGNDFIFGGSGANIIDAGDGDDFITVDSSQDTIDGGAGFDVIEFGQGFSSTTGGIDIDLTNFFSTGSFMLSGNLVQNVEDIMFLDGTQGNDRIIFGTGFTFGQFINGLAGDDELTGTNFQDTLEGGSGNDQLFGLGAEDNLNGGDGDDLINGGDGDDAIVAGTGNDNIIGGNGNDEAFGGSGDDTLRGQAGDDNLYSGSGTDTVFGGSGNDIVYLDISAGDVAHGNGGFDTLTISPPGFGIALDVDFSAFWTGGSVLANGGTVTISGFEEYVVNFSGLADRVIFGNDFTGVVNLSGQEGNDEIEGGSGNDNIYGDLGNDILRGNDGDDQISGGRIARNDPGDDIIDGGNGNDQLFGQAGDDFIFGGNGNDNIIGGDGDDMLLGGAGNDTIGGGDGADTIIGSAGVDEIFAGNGNDLILFGPGLNVDNVDGGIGTDTLRATGDNAQFQWLGGMELQNLEIISDGGFSNVGLVGTNVSDDLDLVLTPPFQTQITYDGDFYFDGRGGNDTLRGNGSANDLRGGIGNDILEGRGGNDELDGGAGSDTASYASASSLVRINLFISTGAQNTVGAGLDLLLNIENLTGSNFNDRLIGNNSANILNGGDGDDLLLGFDGNDQLIGGAGNDILQGHAGADSFFGGAGNDIFFVDDLGDTVTEGINDGLDEVRSLVDYTLGDNVENLRLQINAINGIGNELNNLIIGGGAMNVLHGMGGNDNIQGGSNDDILHGGTGDDFLVGGQGRDTLNGDDGIDILRGQTNSDILNGGDGDDRLFGGDGQDELNGDAGNDTLYGEELFDILNGGAGNDLMFGGEGNDTLDGGDGIDRVSGGAGRDFLTGGADQDYFTFDDGDFSGITIVDTDRVTDFSQIQGDIIRLDQVDAINGGGDDAFTFIGLTAFSGTAGELRYEAIGNATLITGDTDGDGTADFGIRLDGLHTLVATDFQL